MAHETAAQKAATKAAEKAAAEEKAAAAKAAKESAKETEATKEPHVYRTDLGESLPPQAPIPTATDKHK
jgi:hypothetical protein